MPQQCGWTTSVSTPFFASTARAARPIAGIVVVGEAGRVDHRLAAKGRRVAIDLGRVIRAQLSKLFALYFGSTGSPVEARDLLDDAARDLVARVGRPVGERRHIARELAVAVGLGELAVGVARSCPCFASTAR